MTVHACWLFVVITGVAGDAPKAYPGKDLLVEVDALAKEMPSPGYRILDARPAKYFKEGHILMAVWVDAEEWSKAFYKSQDPKEWASRFEDVFLEKDSKVLIYDDNMQKDAARIWWILRYFGHKDVRLLNGGFKAWTAAGQPTTKKYGAESPTKYVISSPDASRFATREDVLKILKDKGTQIIDARGEKEFCGDEKLKNKKGGAIPGALNLEWTEALDKKTHKFKGPEELSEIFRKAGIDLTKKTVTHCQSGGRAAVMAFTLELMGAKGVANYYRGWSEWGNREDTPVVTPEKKK